MSERKLEQIEHWFLEVITHPQGVVVGASSPAAQTALAATIDEVLLPSERLTAGRRAGIYSGMYFDRLIGVLEEDFPAVKAFLGDDAMRLRCGEYLVAHPSRHSNLNQLGLHFPDFHLHEAADLDSRGFTGSIARLERGIQEVFDGPPSETLSTDELLAVPPESWAHARLVTIPALQLHALAYDVNAWYQRWRDGETGPIPEAQTSWLALYRREYRVWRLPLSQEQYTILSALHEERPLGEALQVLTEATSMELTKIGSLVQAWFRDWTAIGLFASVRL